MKIKCPVHKNKKNTVFKVALVCYLLPLLIAGTLIEL